MSVRKVVATIGPATATAERIVELRIAGMDVARLNGSHADLDWHRATIGLIRRAAPDVPILLDIPGRKIRTTQLAYEPKFRSGDTLVLTTDLGHDGRTKVPVNYANLHEDLSPGHTILADDGQLRFTVVTIEGRDIICRAEIDGTLGSAKGINVPMVSLRTDLVTTRDREMLAFAREEGLDFVGISFIESAEHIGLIRQVLNAAQPAIIAKVENQAGLSRVDEIVLAADGIMIDRGDLSVETTLEGVVLSQKKIIRAARRAACPVIVATEMLHSMMGSATPTKAEVSDIANAVLDGASAVMLSGETAVGRYPIQAVQTMRRIVDHSASFAADSAATPQVDIPRAVSAAVGTICAEADISKIVTITRSGYAARIVSRQLPRQPILAVSNDGNVARSFNLLPGVTGVVVDVPFSRTSMDHIPECLHNVWRRGLIIDSDVLLVVALSYPKSGNRMNTLTIHRVQDLVETLGWKR